VDLDEEGGRSSSEFAVVHVTSSSASLQIQVSRRSFRPRGNRITSNDIYADDDLSVLKNYDEFS